MDRTFVYDPENPKREGVLGFLCEFIRQAGQKVAITVAEPTRGLDQNAAMWPALTDFARQVDWPHTVNGQWQIGKMSKESWKAVLTAAFEGETSMAQGLGGGMVMLGARTSKYSRRKMADFLKFVRAEGNERDVIWSEKAKGTFAEYIDSRNAA